MLAYRDLRASARLSAVGGLAALIAGVLVLVLALELRIRGAAWLPWILIALAPATAGGLSLSKGRRAVYGPAAVFGSCTAVIGVTVPVGIWRSGAVIAVIAALAAASGAGAVAAALAVRVTQARVLTSNRRLVAWCAAAAAVAVLSVPSPAYFPPGPIGTVFTGDTGSQDFVIVVGLLLVALPLIAAGLVAPRISAAIAAGWLPVAVAQLIAGPIIQTAPASLDAWYYLTWLPWLAVAVLALIAAGLLKAHPVGRGQAAQQRQRGEDDQQ
jgi:hypothetical protein